MCPLKEAKAMLLITECVCGWVGDSSEMPKEHLSESLTRLMCPKCGAMVTEIISSTGDGTGEAMFDKLWNNEKAH